jgi:acyl-CoA synthetase (AMP-forming)/AMP-acid ligase II
MEREQLATMTSGVLAPDATVTERVIALAAERGSGSALIDAADGTATSWPEFGRRVLAAAAGLARRGLQPGDTVGVYVPDAASHALAVHAIRAAGGVPSPVRTTDPVGEVAAQLTECAARMLFTAPPLTDRAFAAADRSWVRQVIAFGSVPGAIPFGSLVSDELPGSIFKPARGEPALLTYAGARDGSLRASGLTHEDLAEELRALAARTKLTEGDVVIAVPPWADGRAYTTMLDLVLVAGATVVAAPSEALHDAIRAFHGTAVIEPGGLEILR